MKIQLDVNIQNAFDSISPVSNITASKTNIVNLKLPSNFEKSNGDEKSYN